MDIILFTALIAWINIVLALTISILGIYALLLLIKALKRSGEPILSKEEKYNRENSNK